MGRLIWVNRLSDRDGRVASSAVLVAALVVGCGRSEDPPGRTLDRAGAPSIGLRVPGAVSAGSPFGGAVSAGSAFGDPTPIASEIRASSAGAEPGDAQGRRAGEPGHGAKIASIAMRTWIYVAPHEGSTKLGYLRAGAVVDRADESAGTDGCAGGWYRIVPRGYVCVGKGASLSLDHPVVEAAVRGPDRKAAVPYHYVISRAPPPHLYFRLPTAKDQERVEGSARGGGAGSWLNAIPIDPVPAFLTAGRELPKPYGAEEKLRYSVHAGRAKESSAFGLITTFEWTGRRFGLTTELDLIPLDRTKPATLSGLHGVVIDPPAPADRATGAAGQEPNAPAAVTQSGVHRPSSTSAIPIPAIVILQGVRKQRQDDKGNFHEDGPVAYHSGWALTGRNNGSPRGLVETTEGSWLPAEALLIAQLREDPAGYAREGRKWIDVSIRRQMLVAYEGKRPVFATLVSTGIGELGDPVKTHATIRGTFLIHAKHVSGTMDGDEASDSFDLRDVPYIQYFHEGFALHGAYWHDEFGKVRSHGCVNLAPADAAWLFEWTDPIVPPEWHGAVNLEGGTLVYTHA